jgi:phosphohistidine phosphatase
MEITFDQIITSPLLRTRQTADVFADALPNKPPVTNCDALAPGGKGLAVIDELSKYARKSRIALVGHEPEIGELAQRLLGARGPIEFKKGAICRIDLETLPPTRPGHLRWFVTPGILRRIRK